MAPSPEAVRSASGGHGFPWRAAGVILVTVLALVGAGLIGLALAAPQPPSPPQPDPAAAPPFLTAPSAGTGAAEPTAGTTGDRRGANHPDDGDPDSRGDGDGDELAPRPVGMPRSTPTRVRIPRIGVDAKIVPVGLDRNRELQVPPLDKPHLTGWYELGPSPGEVGNAVVVGHVDSRASGPAVFFRLGELKPGDTVEVVRADGEVARFVVDGVARYPKDAFPTELVYGPADKAQLRLVTCGGTFDRRTQSYRDNVVVFATLVEE